MKCEDGQSTAQYFIRVSASQGPIAHHTTMSDAAPPASGSGDGPQQEPPSKNALKKAQKEKEKARTTLSCMTNMTNIDAGREEGCCESPRAR